MAVGGAGLRELSVLDGVKAAVALPLHLRGNRLRKLTRDPEDGCATGYSPADVTAAFGAGQRTLRALARARVPGWRNTCLYRAALHCLLLRRAGHAAVVRIGARRGAHDIEAHAWVEVRGEAIAGSEAVYAPLQRHSVPIG